MSPGGRLIGSATGAGGKSGIPNALCTGRTAPCGGAEDTAADGCSHDDGDGVPVTLFLTTDAIRDDEKYFDRLRPHGAVIEAHTITHTELRGKSYAFQRHEICGSADRLGARYQRRPVLFRPPFGTKDATTLRAAHDCGIKAAFMWTETVHKGKVRYQQEHKVKPGDIILMHFRPAFVRDFLAALRAIHKAGLTPALLEDYIPG